MLYKMLYAMYQLSASLSCLIVMLDAHHVTSQSVFRTYYSLAQNTQNCTKLDRFARSLANFTYCSLVYAVPYNLCTKCRDDYTAMKAVYHSLVYATSDPIMGNETCGQDIISKDKMTNIQNYYMHTTTIWSAGNCDSKRLSDC